MPKGKYKVLAVIRLGDKPVLGTALDMQIVEPLPERLKKLKGIPVSAKKLEEFSDIAEVDGKKLYLFHTVYNTSSGKKSGKKLPYSLGFSLRDKDGGRYTILDKVKAKLNVYIVGPTGKIVLRKKLKLGKSFKPLCGKLPPGPYLVITWIDYNKKVRLGEYFNFYLNQAM